MQAKETMQDFVINMLKEKIPATYTYHNFGHTLYVQQKAMELSAQAGLNKHETDLLNTAALWHDTGYVNTYKGHEEESCMMATEYLPRFGYNKTDIERICGMIMATRIPQTAHNILEEMLADADLAYLGSAGVQQKAEDLYNEIKFINKGLTKNKWNLQQVNFLSAHQYFTIFYKDKKEAAKNAYLEEVKKSIKV